MYSCANCTYTDNVLTSIVGNMQSFLISVLVFSEHKLIVVYNTVTNKQSHRVPWKELMTGRFCYLIASLSDENFALLVKCVWVAFLNYCLYIENTVNFIELSNL